MSENENVSVGKVNHADIVDTYQRLGTAKAVAACLSVSYETVRNVLKSQGVQLKRGRRPKAKTLPI